MKEQGRVQYFTCYLELCFINIWVKVSNFHVKVDRTETD